MFNPGIQGSWALIALFSMIMLVIKMVSEKVLLRKINEWAFIVLFYAANAVLVLPLALQVRFGQSGAIYALIGLTAFLSVFGIYFLTSAIQKLDLSFTQTFGSVQSLLVLAFGFVLLGETLTQRQFAGAALVLAAAALMFKEEAKVLHQSIAKTLHTRAVFFMMLSIVFGVATSLLDRVILRSMDAVSYLVINRFVLVGLFILFTLTQRQLWAPLKQAVQKSAFKIVVVATINLGAVFGYYLALSDPAGKVGLVVSIRNLSIVVIALLGGRMLHEKDIWQKSIFSALMVAGLYLICA